MKKITWFVFIILAFLLTGCNQDTYEYIYDINIENYNDLVVMKFQYDIENDIDQALEVTFETKYGQSVMDDVQITFKLNTTSRYPQMADASIEYKMSVNEESSVSEVYFIQPTQAFHSIEVIDIQGSVLTNDTSIEKPLETNTSTKASMDEILAPYLLPLNQFYVEYNSSVNNGFEWDTKRISTFYNSDPFYYEVSDGYYEGQIIQENSKGTFDVVEFKNISGHYYQKINELTEWNQVLDWSNLKFEDDWQYVLKDNVYQITGPRDSLLKILIYDAQELASFDKSILNHEITIELRPRKDYLVFSSHYWIDSEYHWIDTFYSPNDVYPTNLNHFTKQPPQSLDLIDEITDTSVKISNYIELNTDQYYKVETEKGMYALKLTPGILYEVYDENLNVVNKVAGERYNLFYGFSLYPIETGIYYVKLTNNYLFNRAYDFTFYRIDNYYTTIGTIDYAIPITNNFELDIEGIYDFVYAYYDAPSGGVLVLNTTSSFIGYVDYVSGDYRFYKSTATQLILLLHEGRNYFLFRNPSFPIHNTFSVLSYGITLKDIEPLTDQFSSDYQVSATYELPLTYALTLKEDSTVDLFLLHDPLLNPNNEPIAMTVIQVGSTGEVISQVVVHIGEAMSLTLSEGNYRFVFDWDASIKIRADVTPIAS